MHRCISSRLNWLPATLLQKQAGSSRLGISGCSVSLFATCFRPASTPNHENPRAGGNNTRGRAGSPAKSRPIWTGVNHRTGQPLQLQGQLVQGQLVQGPAVAGASWCRARSCPVIYPPSRMRLISCIDVGRKTVEGPRSAGSDIGTRAGAGDGEGVKARSLRLWSVVPLCALWPSR